MDELGAFMDMWVSIGSVWRVGVWVGVSCALSLRWTKHGVEGVK